MSSSFFRLDTESEIDFSKDKTYKRKNFTWKTILLHGQNMIRRNTVVFAVFRQNILNFHVFPVQNHHVLNEALESFEFFAAYASQSL